MKITKSRLLQIIREEVELHEKNLQENTYELDEKDLSDEEEKKVIDNEIAADKEAGNLEEEAADESGMEEDALYKQPKTGKVSHAKIEPQTNSRKILSVKIR